MFWNLSRDKAEAICGSKKAEMTFFYKVEMGNVIGKRLGVVVKMKIG